MSLNRQEEDALRALLTKSRFKRFLTQWSPPFIAGLGLVGSLITGLHYYVKPDVSALQADVLAIHTDIGNIRSDIAAANGNIQKANERIDRVLQGALDKLVPAPPATKPRAALLNGIDKIPAILAVAEGSNTELQKAGIIDIVRRLGSIAATDPQSWEATWRATQAIADYSSTITPVPSDWIGPAPQVMPEGFPGLFGVTELNDVHDYASRTAVPLDQGYRLIPLRTEKSSLEEKRRLGIKMAPLYLMVVGNGRDSNIVLDKLHLRNVILKNMNVILGGGETLLENVSFVDCRFRLVRNEKTMQLVDLLVKREPVTLGP